MRIPIRIRCSLAMIAMLTPFFLGCDAMVPETSIWLAGEREPLTDQDDPIGCALEDVVDGQGVSIRHMLPPEVETELPVQILVETPCTSSPATMRHDVESIGSTERGVARTTVVAPVGASCSLTVTVEIANDIQICSSRDDELGVGGTADPNCSNLHVLCADEPDEPERM